MVIRMEKIELIKEIHRLKKERNAVIVAHNYQNDEVQEIADFVGDSLMLSKYCEKHEAQVILFCGVHFMAESAKILSPNKTVLLPEKTAGCPMADMITAEQLIEFKKEHPNKPVVCYINSSAEVKAESDVICTSSNAIKIVDAMKEEEIIFAPDKNLGAFVASKLPHKKIMLWDGYCPTHHRIKEEEVLRIKELHQDAKFLIHPECTPEILKLADFIGSTTQIIDYATKSEDKKFIIGTEMGVLFQLKKDNPNKEFFIMSQGLVCPNMKITSLKSVYESLKDMKHVIDVDNEVAQKAKFALDKMHSLS